MKAHLTAVVAWPVLHAGAGHLPYPVHLRPFKFHSRMQASTGPSGHLPHIRDLLPGPAGSRGLEFHYACRHLRSAPGPGLLLGAFQSGTLG